MANSRVILDTNQRISPLSQYDFGDSHIPWRFEFYDDGNLHKIMLISNVTINDISYKRNTEVFFYPNGILEKGVLAKKMKIAGREFNKGDTLLFDNKGTLLNNK